MKRRYAQLSILSLIIFSMIPMAVMGQGTHNLEWGIEIGEAFTYVLQRKVGDQAGFDYISTVVPFISHLDEGQKMIANFTGLDDIPSEINTTLDEPRSLCNLIRENDSETIITGSNGFAITIGDWNFIQNIRNITVDNGYTLIDTESEWGYYASGVYPGSNEVMVYQELRYEKENGTLSYYQWSFTQYSTTILDVILTKWKPGIHTILPLAPDLSFYLLAGIGISLAAVCCFLTYRGFKRRTTLMEELGK